MPPTRPRSGLGWKVATFVLAALLLMFLAVWVLESAVSLMEGGSLTSGPRLQEVTLESSRAEDKIAVIPIEGLIASFGGSRDMVRLIKDQLKSAQRDESVKAVVLKVNSPGGEVLAADDISRALVQFQKQSGKPVVAALGSLAASGGYYVSAPCRWIVANELTLTGSIGVILQTYNYRGLMDKVGLLPETFKSGPYKDMLSGSKKPSDITEQERAMVQALVDQTYARFKTVVAEGRQQAAEANRAAVEPGRSLAPQWADYADGRVLSGKQAFELGFVDELGDFEAAVARAKKLAGISDASVVQYRPVFDLGSFLELFGRSDAGRVQVDLGLDLPKLRAGYLYFLSPTYVR